MDETSTTKVGVRGTNRWRHALLARASDLLTRSLDYDTTLRSIARIAIPQLADWTSVYAPGDGAALTPRLVVAHRSARKEALLSRIWQRRPLALADSNPLVQSLRGGATVHTAGDSAAVLQAMLDGDVAQVEMLRRVGLQTVLAVPLVGHGVVLGSMMLVQSRQTRRAFDDDAMLEVASDLAVCCAQAIHNARLFRETKLAIRLRDEHMFNATQLLLQLLAGVREHADGLQEQTAPGSPPRRLQLRRGLAQIELLVREMEHLIRELHATADVPSGD